MWSHTYSPVIFVYLDVDVLCGCVPGEGAGAVPRWRHSTIQGQVTAGGSGRLQGVPQRWWLDPGGGWTTDQHGYIWLWLQMFKEAEHEWMPRETFLRIPSVRPVPAILKPQINWNRMHLSCDFSSEIVAIVEEIEVGRHLLFSGLNSGLKSNTRLGSVFLLS